MQTIEVLQNYILFSAGASPRPTYKLPDKREFESFLVYSTILSVQKQHRKNPLEKIVHNLILYFFQKNDMI